MARTGRPPRPIDMKEAFELARIQCTNSEMAAVLGFSVSGFSDRIRSDEELSEAIRKGREDGKASLRRQQWALARQGSTVMCIWLGKQYLGQTDKNEVATQNRTQVTGLEDKSIGELEKLADLTVIEGGK